MAQACHASVAATHLWYDHENTKNYLADLDNMHKVVLGAKSQDHLQKLADKLAKNEINHKVYFYFLIKFLFKILMKKNCHDHLSKIGLVRYQRFID